MEKLADYAPEIRALCAELAQRYGLTVIGGSTPVRKGKQLHNICYICLSDGSVHEQPKLLITPNERKWWGISPDQSQTS